MLGMHEGQLCGRRQRGQKAADGFVAASRRTEQHDLAEAVGTKLLDMLVSRRRNRLFHRQQLQTHHRFVVRLA